MVNRFSTQYGPIRLAARPIQSMGRRGQLNAIKMVPQDSVGSSRYFFSRSIR